MLFKFAQNILYTWNSKIHKKVRKRNVFKIDTKHYNCNFTMDELIDNWSAFYRYLHLWLSSTSEATIAVIAFTIACFSILIDPGLLMLMLNAF